MLVIRKFHEYGVTKRISPSYIVGIFLSIHNMKYAGKHKEISNFNVKSYVQR